MPVAEETDILKLSGFVGKPEFAKKPEEAVLLRQQPLHQKLLPPTTQCNQRLRETLTGGYLPAVCHFIETDPAHIDINVHPTKQEIKFEDERLVYNYLKVVSAMHWGNTVSCQRSISI